MSEKQTKLLEQTLATCVYGHCSICTIPVYFCNIHAKHLQHTSKTSETIETYACNIRLQHALSRNISMMLAAQRERNYARGPTAPSHHAVAVQDHP